MGIHRVTDMAAIEPLFAGWPENLARSTLDGCMGEAYANDACTAAQIVNADFSFLAGDAQCDEAQALAAYVPEGFRADTLIIAAKENAWYPVIERNFGNRAVKSERYAIRKDIHHFNMERLHGFTQTLPDGVELRLMDGELYRLAQSIEWAMDFVAQFADEADFLARGLGVMALRNGELLAGASSYVIFKGGIEVEIDTRKDVRRQGLATACGAMIVLLCLERGLYPSWDAANRDSVALAEKLGYVFDHPYPIYKVAVKD